MAVCIQEAEIPLHHNRVKHMGKTGSELQVWNSDLCCPVPVDKPCPQTDRLQAGDTAQQRGCLPCTQPAQVRILASHRVLLTPLGEVPKELEGAECLYRAWVWQEALTSITGVLGSCGAPVFPMSRPPCSVKTRGWSSQEIVPPTGHLMGWGNVDGSAPKVNKALAFWSQQRRVPKPPTLHGQDRFSCDRHPQGFRGHF